MTSLDKIRTINRPSLHEELVERLRNMVVEGVLAAGDKVPERELCEKLGVSRTPMREALKVLAADGLLALEPNRGARVKEVTLQELEEVFPLMGALEALAGELACDYISDEQVELLHEAHVKMLASYREKDLPKYFKYNQRIHEIIMIASGNETLCDVYQSLAVRVRRARYMANMSDSRWQEAVREHEEIVEAINARDGSLLGSILKRHLTNKFATVRDWLVSQNTL